MALEATLRGEPGSPGGDLRWRAPWWVSWPDAWLATSPAPT
jgi:hypothetical protein